MARYFFDIVDKEVVIDDEGVEFPDVETATREALQALPNLAKTHIVEQPAGEITVTMRDAIGAPVYRATLTIKTEWLSCRSGLRNDR